MTEKVVVMHDASVYRALQNQKKFNRNITIFSIVVAAYILSKELKKEGEL